MRRKARVLRRFGMLKAERIEWCEMLYKCFDRMKLRSAMKAIKARSDAVARERIRQARIRALTKRVWRRIGIEMTPLCVKILKRYLRKRQFKKALTAKAMQLRNFLLASRHFNALKTFTRL